jgi:hypothetical protein
MPEEACRVADRQALGRVDVRFEYVQGTAQATTQYSFASKAIARVEACLHAGASALPLAAAATFLREHVAKVRLWFNHLANRVHAQ